MEKLAAIASNFFMFSIANMLVLQEVYPEAPGCILGHFNLAANMLTTQKTESTGSILEQQNQKVLSRKNGTDSTSQESNGIIGFLKVHLHKSTDTYLRKVQT